MERVKLEKYISIDFPVGIDATYQNLPHLGIEDFVLCRWSGDELSYIVTADDQPGGMLDSDYWLGIDRAMDMSTAQIKIIKSGSYRTDKNENITYRVYRDSTPGEESTQIFHLLINDAVAYWVVIAMYNYEDVFLVNAEIISIMKSARIETEEIVSSKHT